MTDATSEPQALRDVRFARDAFFQVVLSKNDVTFADVELLDSFGRECGERGGDADVLDQLAFRLRARLTSQLAVLAAVRRARGTNAHEASAC